MRQVLVDYARGARASKRGGGQENIPLNGLEVGACSDLDQFLGLDQAIMQVAKELEHAHPEISEELAIVNLELKAGKRRAEALRNLADRTAVEDLKKLVAVLIQADRFGTGIGQRRTPIDLAAPS